MIKRNVTISIENGLHTRIAAMVVNKAAEIKERYGVELLIKRKNDDSFIGISILALISLRIQQGEIITIASRNSDYASMKAVEILCDYITKDLAYNYGIMNEVDAIIEESTIANEQIISDLPMGIIVIDRNCTISNINSYALKILNKPSKDILGHQITEVIPNSDLPNIITTGTKEFGKIQHINNHILMVNRSPIISDSNIIGAVGVLQDISEIIGMKEINTRFKKLLEASHDMICFVDEYRKITYVNPAYEHHFNINPNDILGKDLLEISPNGLRIKAFTSKEKIENVIQKKEGIEIISNVEPLFIDGEFKGVISLSKPLSEIRHWIGKVKKYEAEIDYYREELLKQDREQNSFKNIIGFNSNLRDILTICKKASQSPSTVLIGGESGTGKELIAKAIHSNSSRYNNAFVKVNCAAIPETLMESELFGYEKGAFTGALKSKPGKFAIANEGTIFLDEIGDLPLSMQVKLLRVLQEKEFESLGSTKSQKIDVRIIAATNRNLAEMVKEGTFREDLYYRLNVISITLPPLRERKDDIRLLVHHFIQKFNTELNKNILGIDNNALTLLERYDWPGNIRELQNVIERAMNLCDSSMISVSDLPFHLKDEKSSNDTLINTPNGEVLPFECYEKEIIKAAMEKYGSYNKAGKALGLTHRTISLKCKKYDIEVSKN